jgi:hypothetical protein
MRKQNSRNVGFGPFWFSHLFETIKVTTNLLEHLKQEFVSEGQWKKLIGLKIIKVINLSIGFPFGPFYLRHPKN